ncbi:MAG: helix-turn-helix domain-containing protein [Pseudomonadota bacterium]
MATNEERRTATRAAILAAARESFVREGYDRTHTSTILERASISRGALYHHFPSKEAVFEAVYIAVVEETVGEAGRHNAHNDSPLEALLAACLAWLKLVSKTNIAEILLIQGPQVLGWKRARDIEAVSSLPPMQQLLQQAHDLGEIDTPSVRVTALLINALLAETALIAAFGKPRASSAVLEAQVRQFIDGLRV